MNVKLNTNPSLGNIQIKGYANTKSSIVNKKAPDVAATVALSKSGRNKARMLNESKIKENAKSEAEIRIDNIIDTVKSGGKLTGEEKRIFNDELRNLSVDYYKNMKDLKLDMEDVLSALKENYMQRQKIFEDLQKEVEANQSEDDEIKDNVMIASYKQEKEEKERLIEILEESLDEEHEKKTDEEPSETDETVKSENTEEVTDDTADTSQVDTKMKALELIEDNKKEISDMKSQSQKEMGKEMECSRQLDHEFVKIVDILDNDEISNEEKMKSYEDYLVMASTYAFEREVYRNMKIFDFETWLMSKIELNAHNDAGEVIKNEDSLNTLMGTEFIKKFMI